MSKATAVTVLQSQRAMLAIELRAVDRKIAALAGVKKKAKSR